MNATTSPRARARVTNNPMSRGNGRTAQGRRVRDLYTALMGRIGNPGDTIIQADVIRAAELRTAAEGLRLKLLAGNSVDPDQLVRLENLASRAERRLIKDAATRKPRPSLHDHLAARAGTNK